MSLFAAFPTQLYASEKSTQEQLQEFGKKCNDTLKEFMKGVPPLESRNRGWTELTVKIFFETLATADEKIHIGKSFIKNTRVCGQLRDSQSL